MLPRAVAVSGEMDPSLRGARPSFSVVIPAYNASATVGSAISSVLAQTCGELEVVVVDDGSSDDTAEVAAAMDDDRVQVISQRNRGLSAARNAGIAVSRGTHVAFLDSDDLWLPRYLELMQAALGSSPQAGFAYTDAYAFDPITGRVRKRTAMQRMRPPVPPPQDPHIFLLELLERNFVYVSAAVPRKVLDEVGGFDERLRAAEDYELWLRIVSAGYGVAWVPGQHALYRTHAAQMSHDEERMYRNLYLALSGLSVERLPSADHRQRLQSRIGSVQHELALHRRGGYSRLTRRRVRRELGRLRQRIGLGDQWYRPAPPEVAAAFADLTAV